MRWTTCSRIQALRVDFILPGQDGRLPNVIRIRAGWRKTETMRMSTNKRCRKSSRCRNYALMIRIDWKAKTPPSLWFDIYGIPVAGKSGSEVWESFNGELLARGPRLRWRQHFCYCCCAPLMVFYRIQERHRYLTTSRWHTDYWILQCNFDQRWNVNRKETHCWKVIRKRKITTLSKLKGTQKETDYKKAKHQLLYRHRVFQYKLAFSLHYSL